MKKNKKIKITLIIVIAVLLIIGFFVYNYFRDENKLTYSEKEWINNKASTVINVNVLNNVNVFGNEGNGVFFDFIKDFSKEHNLSINERSFQLGDEKSNDISFDVKKVTNDKDLILYVDHYVLVSNNNEIITDVDNFLTKKVGIIKSDEEHINKYINNKLNYELLDNKEELMAAFSGDLEKNQNVDYILIPQNEYIDYILTNELAIIHHFSDIKTYYVISLEGDETLASIVRKFYNTWYDVKFNKHYNTNNLKTFIDNLNITNKDQDILTSKVYKLGFVNQSPYEVIKGGSYGGIINIYLQKLTNFSGIEFEYIRYKNFDDLKKSILKGNIDLYFNYYENKTNFSELSSLMNINYYIIAKDSNPLTISSLKGLENKDVYVLKNSKLETHLKNYENINIKNYKDEKELRKLFKEDEIILIDKNIFDFYLQNEKVDYTIRYSACLDNVYNFSVNGDATLYKLASNYFMTLNPNEMKVLGIYNHDTTLKAGTFLTSLAKYLFYIFIIVIILAIVLYRSSKKILIQKRIKKEDKMLFIDMLTSLKNRNYLKENIENWDKNTIYPQAIIVVDLNSMKLVNDTYGHEEGDRQIQAAANILIKTQLDNSDIIRTDGNEFLIYLINYNERQIGNYIRKLYKEFKKLPYEYGAAIGYSMITDDMKLIDDAINEAAIAMRAKKESKE